MSEQEPLRDDPWPVDVGLTEYAETLLTGVGVLVRRNESNPGLVSLVVQVGPRVIQQGVLREHLTATKDPNTILRLTVARMIERL